MMDSKVTRLGPKAAKKARFYVEDVFIDQIARACGWKGSLVYIALCRHMDNKRRCFPSIKRIAWLLGISERSVSRGIKDLEELNIIRIVSEHKDFGPGRRNTYLLLSPSVWKSCGGNESKPVENSPDSTVSQDKDDLQSGDYPPESLNKDTQYKDNPSNSTDFVDQHWEKLLIEELISLLKSFQGLPSLDGSKEENEYYAGLLINEKLLPLFDKWDQSPRQHQIILTFQSILTNTDSFHKKNLTSLKYFYENFGRILPRKIPKE